jgi:hypothetical protein
MLIAQKTGGIRAPRIRPTITGVLNKLNSGGDGFNSPVDETVTIPTAIA